MSRCPTCGHDPDALQQRRAATSRWAGMTPEQRSAEMSRVRRKGIKRGKPAKKALAFRNSGKRVRVNEGSYGFGFRF